MKATRRQLALLRSLRTRKGRRETGLFLVEGRRLCSDLAASGLPVELVLTAAESDQAGRDAQLIDRFRRLGAQVVHEAAHRVQGIADTVHTQGLAAAARWRDRPLGAAEFGKRAIVVALDRVSDPGNVGAVIRSAAWFDVSGVLLGEGCADLLNPKVVRATMGGLFHVPVYRKVDLPQFVARLGEEGFDVAVAATDGGPDWRNWADAPRSLLVLGSEARGVGDGLRRLADRTVAIGRAGAGESLNVAVCAGIFMSVAVK